MNASLKTMSRLLKLAKLTMVRTASDTIVICKMKSDQLNMRMGMRLGVFI
jgi:hypothetical protein